MRSAAVAGLILVCAVALAQPVISAKSAVIIEARTGMVLFQKNSDAKRFPASTTKILTALLLLENTAPGATIVAPPDTETVTGASLYLKPSERISREDALYALMLRSANDVAHAVAVNVAGSDAGFAKMMNERAKQIGCTNSSFNNPHGLKDPKHSTTASDLARIAREAMRNPEFRTACKCQSHVITRSINTQDTLLKTHNKLLKADPLIEGIKTGYTAPAGKCFVGCRNLDGFEIITVVLASEDWVKDTKALCSWAHTQLVKDAVIEKGAAVGRASVKGGSSDSVEARLADDLVVVSKKKSVGSSLRYSYFETNAPVHAGDIVGEAVITLPGDLKHKVSLVAATDVGVATAMASVFPNRLLWLIAAIGGGLMLTRTLLKYGRSIT